MLGTQLVATILTALTMLIAEPFTTHAVYGTSGVLSALAVAYKKLVPEHTVHLAAGLVSVRVKVGLSLLPSRCSM